jgi:hypothetical protein
VGGEVYVKIKQGDKLSSRAHKARWIGFSGQSDSHCIYSPEAHKVSVERNLLFHEESPREAIPIVPTNNHDPQPPGTSRRPSLPSVPPVPGGRSTSKPLLSQEREVEREIEITPEETLEELQPTQKGVSGAKEVAPPRQSERLHLQQEPAVPKGHITRSQAKKHESEQISSLAIEDFSDDAKMSLEKI